MPVQSTSNPNEAAAAYVVNKHEKLKSERGTWETHWQEVAEYIIPLKNNTYGASMTGEKKENRLFDSCGVQACDRLASAFHGMLTNPQSVWFAISSGDPILDTSLNVATWLQNSAKKMIAVMNNSNFQPEIHEVFLDLCGLGTGHLRIEEDAIDVVRFTSRPIYEVCVSENHLGIIDTVSYDYQMTIDQLVEAFPDTLPQKWKDIQRQEPLRKLWVTHLIEPSNRIIEALRAPMLPFSSVHVLKEDKVILKKSGFEENPCVIPRISKLSGEMYGRSPGMRALADVKMANAMMRAMIEQAQLTLTPPIQIPDDGVLMPVRLEPKGQNVYRAGSKDRIERLDIAGNLAIGQEMIEMVHRKVDQAFYIDQLHLVESDRMTATEVMQRKDEQLRSMSPILGRLQHELLRPLIERVFGIMMRSNLFDEIPPEMANAKLEVRFVSQLARAQESVEGDNFMRAFNSIMAVAGAQPTIVDIFNADKVGKFIMKTFGANLGVLNTDDETEQLRVGRAQAQAQQAQLEQGQMTADIAATAAKAQPK